MSRKDKSIETESRFAVAFGRGWKQGVTANGHEASFWNDGNVLKLDCGDGCTTLSVPLGCMPVTADFMVCK